MLSRKDIVEHDPASELDVVRVDQEAGIKNRWRWDWLDKKSLEVGLA
jgi:hypothetical protein